MKKISMMLSMFGLLTATCNSLKSTYAVHDVMYVEDVDALDEDCPNCAKSAGRLSKTHEAF